LFKAGEVPCQGQYSSIDPIALQNGQWAKITNIRTDDATMRVRPPATLQLDNTNIAYAAGDEVVGSHFSFNTNQQIIAVWDASASRVKIWRDNAGTYSEMTDSASRFTTNAPVSFVEVQEGYTAGMPNGPVLALVAQNGYEAPRIIRRVSISYTSPFSVVDTLTPPTADLCTAEPYGDTTWKIGDRVAGNLSVSDADVTASIGTLTGIGTYVSFNYTTATDVNDYGRITFAGSAASTNSQLQIIYNSTLRDIWERVSVAINVGGTKYYLHLAGTTEPIYDDVGNGYSCVAFDCRFVRTGTGITTQSALSSLANMGTTLDFEWTGALPASGAVVLNIFGVLPTGSIPFGVQFASSYFIQETRQESPSVVHKSLFPPTLAATGGCPVPDVRFGSVEGFTYSYSLKVGGGGASTFTRYFCLPWVDESGDGTFRLARGVGSLANAGSGSTTDFPLCQRGTIAGAYSFDNLDPWEDIAPSSLQIPIPTGYAQLFSNDRLFISGNKSSSNPGKLYFSQKSYPFRFSELVDVQDGVADSLSSGATKLNSPVQALASMSASVLGADPVMILTSDALFSTDGVTATSLSSPRKVAPHGTLSPRSVTVYEGNMYWLDNERQFRSLGGLVGGLGVRRVEDVFTGISGSDLANVEGFTFRDRLYLAYKPSGGSANTRAMVYDQRTGIWVQDTLGGSLDFKRFQRIRSSGADLMTFVTTDGNVYEYEGTQTGNEAGSAISVNLWSRALSNPTLQAIRFSHPTIYSDQIPSAVWDFSLFSHRLSTTAAGKIDMDYGSEKSWTVGRGTAENQRVGMSDSAVQLRIEGTAPGGAKIYFISIDREEQGDRKVKRG
jgi:hypothetical protein